MINYTCLQLIDSHLFHWVTNHLSSLSSVHCIIDLSPLQTWTGLSFRLHTYVGFKDCYHFHPYHFSLCPSILLPHPPYRHRGVTMCSWLTLDTGEQVSANSGLLPGLLIFLLLTCPDGWSPGVERKARFSKPSRRLLACPFTARTPAQLSDCLV